MLVTNKDADMITTDANGMFICNTDLISLSQIVILQFHILYCHMFVKEDITAEIRLLETM